MFAALPYFDVAEAAVPAYSAPTIDVLDDEGSEPIQSLVAPIMVRLTNELVWEAVTGATSYIVEKRSGPLWANLTEVLAPFTSYSGAGLTGPAYFRVRAVNSSGKSLPSKAMLLEE